MALNFNWEKTNALARELGGRVALLEELVKAHNNELTYSQIQTIVKEGLAPEFFDIGDEIMTKYTATNGTEYDFPWIVVDFRDVTWEDQTVHPGMILQSKYATAEAIPFDAVESELVDSETETVAQEGWYYFGRVSSTEYEALNLSVGDEIPFSGYSRGIYKCWLNNELLAQDEGINNYKMSSIRQWLNSSELIGEWWHSAHFGDVAPSELNTYNGFLAGFASDFIEIINPIKIQSTTNEVFNDNNIDTMYDKFFLPSVEEMYGVALNYVGNTNSSYFQYWKEKMGLSYPDNAANSGRIVTSVNEETNPPVCWLRNEIYRGVTHASSHAMRTGNVGGGGNVFAQLRALPCCCIS